MKESTPRVMVSVGAALIVASLAGCGGRTVNGTDDAPRLGFESPRVALAESQSTKSDGGAGAASTDTQTSSSAAPEPLHVARTPACVGPGTSCRFDADCCQGSWCNNRTYAPWTCVAPLPNGHSCQTNDHCQSGICQDYTCVENSCVEAGTVCTIDADCCKGSFCDTQSYAPTECTPTLPVGRYCLADRWCQSGHCVGYQCG